MGNLAPVIKITFVAITVAAPLIFPIEVTLLLTLVASGISPLLPLAMGLWIDTLYWSASVSSVPWYTLGGLLASLVAYALHRYVATNISRV